MAVISITFTESPVQKYAGIPLTITLTASIPSTIFYTLDGTDPTTSSSVAIGPITMPTGVMTVVLKAFATDGVDTSGIVSQTYGTSTVPDRQPHDKVTGIDTGCDRAHFPFGSPGPAPGVNGIYGNTGGTTVDNKLDPREATGYDGEGSPTGYMGTPLTQYDWVFSETDDIGQQGRGIGTLPAHVFVVPDRQNNEHQEQSSTSSPFFDPKALVIYQDSREATPDDNITQLMRPYFALEEPGKVRDGALLQTSEGIAPSGALTRAIYNAAHNTVTYYYYDNRVGRWIISTEPFRARDPNLGNMAQMVFTSRTRQGVGFVFKWIPFQYRRLI
jgi:hypothetical protein